MGNITPVTTTTDTAYNNNARDVFYIEDTTTTATATLNKRRKFGSNCRVLSYNLTDWDNADTLLRPIGAVCAAWQANTTSDAANTSIGTGGITFNTGATNPDGWIHIMVRGGGAAPAGSTSDTVTAKGSSGYIDPYRAIYLSHRNASPNNLTNGKIGHKQRYRLQFFPFVTSGDASDTWLAESSRLCPRIVAVAWQPNTAAAVRMAVTQDASGDVTFTPSTGSAATGWLWVWRAA